MVVVTKVVMTMDMVNGIMVNSTLHVHTSTSMVTILIVDGKFLANPIVLPILPLLMMHLPRLLAL